MSTRSILGLIYMVQGLKQMGEDPEPVLARHGLTLAQLDPSTRIERSREMRIYADLAETVKDPLVGLKLGGFYGLAGYGPLIMLLMTCATAYEAFQIGIRYQGLTYLFGTLRFEPGDKLSALVLTPMPMTPRAFRFRVDGEVSGTYKLVRDMQLTLGVDIHAERIDMPYPRPPEAAPMPTPCTAACATSNSWPSRPAPRPWPTGCLPTSACSAAATPRPTTWPAPWACPSAPCGVR